MTQELAIYRSIDDTMTLGKLLAQSGYFADSRDAGQAVVKVLAGAELGFGPIASMTGINIIKGKVTLSANLIAAAIKRSGRYNYRVRKMTDSECEIVFYEGKEEIGVSTFTAKDAANAGLSGDNWRKFPRNMLFARAISNGAKWYCPDLSGGPLYTPDELGAQVDGETGEVIDAPAPRIVVEQPKAQPSVTGNGATAKPNGATQPAQAQAANGNGLPFAGTKRAAVDWAMQYAPQVWPVNEQGFIVRQVVERSFDNCQKTSGATGEALAHAWIAKIDDKLADYQRAQANRITDAELDGDDDPDHVTAGDFIETPMFS